MLALRLPFSARASLLFSERGLWWFIIAEPRSSYSGRPRCALHWERPPYDDDDEPPQHEQQRLERQEQPHDRQQRDAQDGQGCGWGKLQAPTPGSPPVHRWAPRPAPAVISTQRPFGLNMERKSAGGPENVPRNGNDRLRPGAVAGPCGCVVWRWSRGWSSNLSRASGGPCWAARCRPPNRQDGADQHSRQDGGHNGVPLPWARPRQDAAGARVGGTLWRPSTLSPWPPARGQSVGARLTCRR